MNTITAAPEASPSRPSVRFTPFAVAAIMTYAQITNRVDPTAPAANTTLLSRTNETVRQAAAALLNDLDVVVQEAHQTQPRHQEQHQQRGRGGATTRTRARHVGGGVT